MIYTDSPGWYVNRYIGTNVHVILEQYKATENNVGDQINATTHVNGHSDFENVNVPFSDATKANNMDEVAAIEDLAELPGSTDSRRRHIFIFSANDKDALKTQMLDTGTSHH